MSLLLPIHNPPPPPIVDNPTDEQSEAVFLDYFNNYLTVSYFAGHRGISEDRARAIIEHGRAANLRRAATAA